MLPPIKRASNGKTLDTFVVKLAVAHADAAAAKAALIMFSRAMVAADSWPGYAVVMQDDAAYLVHLLSRPAQLTNHGHVITAKLLKALAPCGGVLGSIASVEWVRPLNRHLQRLFCWGDINSKDIEADVEAAAQDEDYHRIRKLVPQFDMYSDEKLAECAEVLPRIAQGLLSPLPTIKDCDHNWAACNGPCGAQPCVSRHARSWNSCSECWMVRCGFCVSLLKARAAEDNDVRKHIEALQQNVPRNTEFQTTQPFGVVDSMKMHDSEKLEWLKAEFQPAGSSVALSDLPVFAALCKEFFHAANETSERRLVFGLFEEFSGIVVGKEAALHPSLREELSVIWGKPLKLCKQCGAQIGNGRFCSSSCERAACPEEFRCPCGNVQAPRVTSGWAMPTLHLDEYVVGDLYSCSKCNRTVQRLAFTSRGERRVVVHPPELAVSECEEPAWKSRRRA